MGTHRRSKVKGKRRNRAGEISNTEYKEGWRGNSGKGNTRGGEVERVGQDDGQ
jgi:hypothetical protein